MEFERVYLRVAFSLVSVNFYRHIPCKRLQRHTFFMVTSVTVYTYIVFS